MLQFQFWYGIKRWTKRGGVLEDYKSSPILHLLVLPNSFKYANHLMQVKATLVIYMMIFLKCLAVQQLR